MNEDFRDAADAVYDALLDRIGEEAPQPRLDATRRVTELLGDPQTAYPIIHVAGTNGKTSTSRLIESILRAYGLRTGLLTSPHLERFTERILIDGEPITDEAVAANWADIQPYLEMVDRQLVEAADAPLTYFEALTILAFASFADAPVDVVVLEVGMGGEWDSTNVADADVAVFTPIDLDHTARLGNTLEEIALTKSGIIKPAASVVSAIQQTGAAAVLERAADLTESSLAFEGREFGVEHSAVAVGGQVLDLRGLAGEYRELFLPLLGDHQAQNAAVAVAAVESFLGSGGTELSREVLEEGLATATSPGRLQLVGIEPSVLVDAAHNPHGARALVSALGSYFDFDAVGVVFGVLRDKDAQGILEMLMPVAAEFFLTRPNSARALDVDDLADLAETVTAAPAHRFDDVTDALESARSWAAQEPRRAVLVTGSISLVGEAMGLAASQGWMGS
jgi:dihydrofolate synthase / folylpolyglutamate synthase